MRFVHHLSAAAWLTGLALVTGCSPAGQLGSELSGEGEVDVLAQPALRSRNGLVTVNGLRTRNGLISTNGLTTTNGLRTRNGLTTLNGLRTRNGMLSVSGLSVDCTSKTLGTSCTGAPDGLLSASTGLMRSADGVHTASYLLRCALPARQSIRIKDFTGALVTLQGELGLAPEWRDTDCDQGCQEKVSACLMAFTNGDGKHVDLEMTAPFTLGANHSSEYIYQEASFYGNMFTSPPQTYFCVGKDFARGAREYETRACAGYNELYGECPYEMAGYCNNESVDRALEPASWGVRKCSFTGTWKDIGLSCQDNASLTGLARSDKSWNYPITTFRNVRL